MKLAVTPTMNQIDYLRSYDYDAGNYDCVATFATSPMSCGRVEELLIGPVEDLVRGSDQQAALHAGLQAYVTANSVLANNSKEMNRQTRGTLQAMKTDMRRLLTVLQADAAHVTTTRTIRTADNDQALTYARQQLLIMHPAQLVDLCKQIKMPIDELGLRRKTGRKDLGRELRMYDLDALGADSVVLRSRLVSTLFTGMDLRSPTGIETVHVLSDDVATLPDEYKRANFISDHNKSDGAGSWLPKWDATFSSDVVAKREIVPVISWSAVGERHQSYWQRRKRFNWLGSSIEFDERSRTLTLFSPLAGALLLAAAVGLRPDATSVGRFFMPDFDNRRVRGDRYSGRGYLPPIAIAAVPAILARPDVTHDILHCETFEKIEHIVAPSAGRLRQQILRYDDAEAGMAETPPRQWPTIGHRLSIGS